MARSFLIPALCLAVLAAPMAAQTAGAPPKPNYATHREFKSRIFLIQHRSVRQIRDLLRPLGSGFEGTAIDAEDGQDMKAISVRDFPENLAAMEEAVKRLDQPQPAPKDLEFHLHILFASKQERASEGVPEELKEVLAALKSTLSYRSYTLASTSVLRSCPNGEHLAGLAQAETVQAGPKGDRAPVPVTFNWAMSHWRMEPSASGPDTVSMDFELDVLEPNGSTQAKLSAALRLKVGEKVVVGTTTLKDRGLIVVLTAKILD